MMSFTYLAPHMRYDLAGFLFLTVMSEVALCLYKFSCRGKVKYCLKNIALLLLLILFLSYVMTADAQYAVRLPWLSVPLVGVLVLVHAALGFRNEYRRTKQFISPLSVKQALDNLNSGICFADKRGKLILINYKMRNLIHSLGGFYPQMLDEIESVLAKYAEQTEENKELYRFADGKIFRFHTTFLAEPELRGFTQTTAQDVTELYEATVKLRTANMELQETNNRLEKMYNRLADRIREQETLNLKMRIHDNIGTSLIAISDMQSSGAEEDMDAQLAALQDAVGYFSGDRFTPLETFEELRIKASQMNVKLHLSGRLPSDAEILPLIVSAVHECVTNCVYHAKGSNVFAEITDFGGACTVTVTNDGEAPTGEIIEGGGLSALRQSIEGVGGEMHISHSPRFALIFTLKRKERKL